MKSYIITRFSIFGWTKQGFQMTSDVNKEGYRSKLFSPLRLNHKFNVFEKITLPSILNQTNINWEWVIYASTFLPEEYQKRLLELTSPHPKIKCKFIDSFKEFIFEPKKCEDYCTLRLDDDDGLAPTFLEKLQPYAEKKGVIVCHSRGIKFTVDEKNEIIYGKKTRNIGIAVGLCGIGINIYDCGCHGVRLKENYTLINRNDPDMYYLCCSDYCDSKRKF
jgi:hypothetical protein